MTTYQQSKSQPSDAHHEEASHSNGQSGHTNVGTSERIGSIAAGALLTLFGLRRRTIPGLALAGIGSAMIHRGVTGECQAYKALGIDTTEEAGGRGVANLAERGIHVEQATIINRPAQELYDYWRRVENLPNIMTHVKSIKMLDDRRSHWVVDAPVVAGGAVEWDAEITADEPAKRIAWRSAEGSEVTTRGEIRFAPALGDRGTEVHVSLEYLPPAGKLGHWIATVFGKAPRRQIHEDLRNFKRIMEIGELPTTVGQPRGRCLASQGKREGE